MRGGKLRGKGRKEVREREERKKGKENIMDDKERLYTERKAEAAELRQYEALVERRER